MEKNRKGTHTLSRYLDQFPIIPYDIAKSSYSNYTSVTNIFFRLAILKSVLGDISAYYEYSISDSDLPETLAENIYGDAEAHWIILLANDIIDPQYDWPLNSRDFNNYIVSKYGSLATAKTQIHHYEKVITREQGNTTSETRFVISESKLTNNSLDVPFDYYSGSGSLPETQSVETHNLSGGKTVIEVIRREAVYVYDYEMTKNEEKRNIKIIKPEYYGIIMNEFANHTKRPNASYLRKLV